MKNKTMIAAAIMFLLASSAMAEAPKMKLDNKWTKAMGIQVADIVVTDVDGDGKDDVIVGLVNNTVITYNNYGIKIAEYTLGNASKIGRIYSMALGDVDQDGQDEVIFGLGGAKEIRTYDPHDFEFTEDFIVKQKSSVLYRVQRYKGSVFVTEKSGELVWRHATLDSTRAVDYVNSIKEGGFVIAGVGDLAMYTYNEQSTDTITDTQCIYMPHENVMSGWSTSADCNNKKKCCPTQKDCSDCSAKWDSSEEVCYIDFTEIICGDDIGDVEIIGWHYVTYKVFNSSVFFLDRNGRNRYSFPIVFRDNITHKPIELVPSGRRLLTGSKAQNVRYAMVEVNNGINGILGRDIDYDGLDELLVASRNGEFYTINITNLSSIVQEWNSYMGGEVRVVHATNLDDINDLEVIAGNNEGEILATKTNGEIIWKQMVDDAITGITSSDVEGDDSMDIIVTSRDMNMYIFDSSGNIIWTYNLGEPAYGIKVKDMDGNGLQDFVVFTTENVTRLQMNEFYIKKFRADGMYDRAYDSFSSNDYTRASVYIDMAFQMYEEIDDRDSIPKCKLLRARIDDEFKITLKKEADRFYGLSLNYYAINELDAAMNNIQRAKEIYEKIDDEVGIQKCDSLSMEIMDDKKSQRKLNADGLYTKAISLSNFGNYTGALEFLNSAIKVYDDIGFFNESIKCEAMIIGIGDKHLNMADMALKSRNFQKAIIYASTAKEIYNNIGRKDLVENANEIINLAQEGLLKPVEDLDQKSNLAFYMTIAIMVLVFLIILTKIQARPKGRTVQIEKEPVESYSEEDEIEDLELGEI